MIAAAIVGAAGAGAAEKPLQGSFPIVELRQYTLHDGERDTLIRLFEEKFIESQEALGMKVIGTFTDLDRPNRFVWLRGFRNMDSRVAGLTDFYGGPIWKANRDAANATMIDSDNVLLLHAPDAAAEFKLPSTRPAPGENSPAGLIVATIYYLKGRPAEALSAFENSVKPALEQSGVQPIAWFVPETASNNFPRLPVREGERVLVWFGAFSSEVDHRAHEEAIAKAASSIRPFLDREPEILRLKPTARSELRGLPVPDGGEVHDFDFLHGKWNVTHHRLKERGRGSAEWVEFSGTAETRPLLGGLCNVEEHRIEGRDFSGVALRCFDRKAKLWSIYWVSQRDGLLQPPVVGNFANGRGEFEGDDTDGGRPIRVRFFWRRISAVSAHWEQAFSYDGGKTWETNWTMDFRRPQL